MSDTERSDSQSRQSAIATRMEAFQFHAQYKTHKLRYCRDKE